VREPKKEEGQQQHQDIAFNLITLAAAAGGFFASLIWP
jgi:hypothetical protein